MARTTERLNDLAVRRAHGRGVHPDGGGLYLQVSQSGSKSWLFRYKLLGKGHWMGLGAYPTVTLAKARKDAVAARELVSLGTDPVMHRTALAAHSKQHEMTFRRCAEDFIAAQKPGWRNAKHAGQWSATLAAYAYRVFGNAVVNTINTELVLKALRPIWQTKPETATRVRQRIEAVINWAIAHGYSEQVNPARWRGHLDKLLPRRSKVRAVVHHPAMAYADLPDFFAKLRSRETPSALALAFTILTAARSGEVRSALWPEINLDERLWTIPAEHTKTRRAHRVALSAPAIAVLKQAAKLKTADAAWVFPGAKAGQTLSENTMLKTLQQELGLADLTVHGFRSTFRDWAGEKTNIPREVAEAALAHSVRDKSEAAYARSDLFERRRKLMDTWAVHCTNLHAAGVVTPLRRRS